MQLGRTLTLKIELYAKLKCTTPFPLLLKNMTIVFQLSDFNLRNNKF